MELIDPEMRVDKLKIPYYPTPYKVVKRMIQLANLRPQERLIDLGSGDGRIPITTALIHDDVFCYGVELNQGLISIAEKRIKRMGLKERVKIINGDLFKIDLAKYDVITVYLTVPALNVLKDKFKDFLIKGGRIISHDYGIPGFKPILAEPVVEGGRRHFLYLYTVKSVH